jgi:hypothetical protein
MRKVGLLVASFQILTSNCVSIVPEMSTERLGDDQIVFSLARSPNLGDIYARTDGGQWRYLAYPKINEAVDCFGTGAPSVLLPDAGVEKALVSFNKIPTALSSAEVNADLRQVTAYRAIIAPRDFEEATRHLKSPLVQAINRSLAELESVGQLKLRSASMLVFFRGTFSLASEANLVDRAEMSAGILNERVSLVAYVGKGSLDLAPRVVYCLKNAAVRMYPERSADDLAIVSSATFGGAISTQVMARKIEARAQGQVKNVTLKANLDASEFSLNSTTLGRFKGAGDVLSAKSLKKYLVDEANVEPVKELLTDSLSEQVLVFGELSRCGGVKDDVAPFDSTRP